MWHRCGAIILRTFLDVSQFHSQELSRTSLFGVSNSVSFGRHTENGIGYGFAAYVVVVADYFVGQQLVTVPGVKAYFVPSSRGTCYAQSPLSYSVLRFRATARRKARSTA